MARRAPADRLEAALDQLGPGLGQHLDRHIIGDQPLLDQLADESKVGLRCRGKADFDLLEAEPHQQLEHPAFAVRSHRLDQRLVPVAQVDAAPQRRAVDDPRRPAPVGQIDGRKGTVFVDRHAGHRKLLVAGSPPNLAVPLLKSGRIAAGWPSKPPTGAKSATETRLSIRRGNGRKPESVVQIEKRHRHQRARKCPELGRATTAARRPSGRRAAKSKLVALAMHGHMP